MTDILFYNGRVITPQQTIACGYACIKDGKITAVAAGDAKDFPAKRKVDLSGRTLSPGLIEMHSHGGGGHDFMDGTAQTICGAAKMHLRHGVTSICPTSMACYDDELFALFDAYEEAKTYTDGMPHLTGIHLEGPYFSPEQAGAQPVDCMTKPFPDHAQAILERSGGNIVRWSCAPEVDGVLELGDELRRRGILASIAHTDADLALVERAMQHGFTHLTHFYSGMSTIKRVNARRVLGVVEAGYLFDELHVEIIADGLHLPPELLRLILKLKPHHLITLVTDSMRGAGMPEGPSVLGSLKRNYPVFVEGGIAMMPDRKSFAGSVATADHMLRVMVREAGLTLREAVNMMSVQPARLIGLDEKTGSIQVGKAADLVIFDGDIQVCAVYVNGNEINKE